MELLTGLTTFIRTVELGSQAAAAKDLGLSRMAVGRQIRALEQKLHVQLLQRTTRRQILTEAGSAFIEQARPALQQLRDAALQASEFQTSLRGSLRVSAPVSFTPRSLSPLLARFSAQYPDLHIELILNDRQVNLIEEGFDLALRIGPLRDSPLMSRRLAQFPIIPCASPAYLERHGVPAEPEDLLRHNCLRYADSSQMQGWILAGRDGTRRNVPVRGNLVSNNGDALLAAAIAGQGIVMQPSFIVGEALRDGQLIQLMPGRYMRQMDLHGLFPPARLIPTKLRRLLGFLVEAYRSDAAAFGVEAVAGDG